MPTVTHIPSADITVRFVCKQTGIVRLIACPPTKRASACFGRYAKEAGVRQYHLLFTDESERRMSSKLSVRALAKNTVVVYPARTFTVAFKGRAHDYLDQRTKVRTLHVRISSRSKTMGHVLQHIKNLEGFAGLRALKITHRGADINAAHRLCDLGIIEGSKVVIE